VSAKAAQVRDARDARANGPKMPPTNRQRQLLALICSGMTYGEAATVLGIQVHTVKNLMSQALAKMGARNCNRACFEIGKEVGRKEGSGV
jgi:DNA-binding CsgD family transcriptional regulator